MCNEILIAGASVRSAAQSAVRAGLQVAAADLFCDRDLPPECLAYRVEDYPRGILHIAQQMAPRPWSYTGGLENHPDLVDAVSCRHELLGNAATLLSRIRDPWLLQQVLQHERILFPNVLAQPPDDQVGTWLRKPIRSCGGMHMEVYRRGASSDNARDSRRNADPASRQRLGAVNGVRDEQQGHFYYQRRIRGTPYGALFVGSQGAATLLGVTRQLVGCPWAGATGLRYVGSVGPIDMGTSRTAELQRIGDCLAAEFALRGLFGVDVIVAGSRIWVLEVNPRFTASVEILERATGMVAMAVHLSACRSLPLPDLGTTRGVPIHAKAIIYARQSGVVSAEFYRALGWQPNEVLARYADLPHEGSTVSAGHPILTAFAHGDQLPAVLRQLRARASRVQRSLS